MAKQGSTRRDITVHSEKNSYALPPSYWKVPHKLYHKNTENKIAPLKR